MSIKIRQLTVNGKLNSNIGEEITSSETSKTSDKIYNQKIKELRDYVDKSIEDSFKEVCESTTEKILENIYKRSDF